VLVVARHHVAAAVCRSPANAGGMQGSVPDRSSRRPLRRPSGVTTAIALASSGWFMSLLGLEGFNVLDAVDNYLSQAEERRTVFPPAPALEGAGAHAPTSGQIE
jgi:hypothetical protein